MGLVHNVYMGIASSRQGRRQGLRTYGPYLVTGVLLFLMVWWAQGMKKDLQRENLRLAYNQRDPATRSSESAPSTPEKDWTHKIVVQRQARDDAPDDDTADTCPTPTGNWAHTCQRNVLIEGPCSNKCLLTAVCMDVHNKMQNTTFEYAEREVVEIKNVNGLLCRMKEDGSLSCGLNFHGNVATKNCRGYVPRRHETRADGMESRDTFRSGAGDARGVDCGRPPSTPGVDFALCRDTVSGETCYPRCLPGYTGSVTARCTTDGWRIDGSCSATAPKDWTHKLSLDPIHDDDHPNDHNELDCPTPTGNWQHTCLERIIVEGPCNGKCLLQARCRNLNKVFQDTTFEYNEGHRLEIKNVNGLLCRMAPDGSPQCGMNFHGNLARKNCPAGHIPHRHELLAEGLPASTERKPAEPEVDRDRRDAGRQYQARDYERPTGRRVGPVDWDRGDDDGRAGRRTRYGGDADRPRSRRYEEF